MDKENNISESKKNESCPCSTIESDSKNNNDKNDLTMSVNMDWSKQHEEILIEWADKALCYRWLHGECRNNYTYKNTCLQYQLL